MVIGTCIGVVLISAFSACMYYYLSDNESDEIDNTLETSINSAIQALVDKKGIEAPDGPGYPIRRYVYDKQTRLLAMVYEVTPHHKVYIVRKNKDTVYTSGEMRLKFKRAGNWYNRLLFLLHSP